MLKALRERLTFSNAISLAALFIALGGSAYAALDKNSVGTPQLKKNAVTTAKIRANAVTTAKIKKEAVTGAKIKLSTLGEVPKADTAAPLAYARVSFPGTVNPAFSKNIKQANLTHPTTGVYCFRLPFTVKTGQATAEGDPEPDDLASIEILGPNEAPALSSCPAGNDVEVTTLDTGDAGQQDADFYIELND
jgi:hypothetical protein